METEKIKSLDPKSSLLKNVIACLYNKISDITKIVSNIQKIKNKAFRTLKNIENSRKKPTGDLPKPLQVKQNFSEDFSQQNTQIFIELSNENDIIDSTQETAIQLGEVLKLFQQKVAEQEFISFSILKDAENSLSNMKTANYHLNSANEYSKGMEKIWIVYFLTMTFILVFYDWWTSKVVYVNN